MSISVPSTVTSPTPEALLGGEVREYVWNWENQPIRVVYESLGAGDPILLLPAFSTVSSRTEMVGLAQNLADRAQVFSLDWPGFGQSSRLPFDYQPALFCQFLADFIKDTFHQPPVVIAAGHAAGYALQQPQAWSKIVLVAPTWRGPLPTMGASPGVARTVRQMVRSPLVGQLLYKLNTAPSFLRFMYRRHVFTNPDLLSEPFIEQKWQMTQQPGARFAPAAFVTGRIDPVSDRTEFLNLLDNVQVPVMVIVSEQAPPQSKAEMEAMTTVSNVQALRLPGSLGMHEEYATPIAEAIRAFLFTPS